MKKLAFGTVVLLSTAGMVLAAESASERLAVSADVFNEIMSAPDRGIPQDLLAKAECVIVIPGMKKGAFVVGAEYGRGFAECRSSSGGGWGAPGAVKIEGGSLGAQIGGSSTDVVMLVMNRRGMDRLMGDKFTLGADASVAAGPVGRTANAETDAKMSAEILAWSRAKGLFAGIALNGASLRPDEDTNAELYGKKVGNREVLNGELPPPSAAQALRSELDKFSMRR